MLKYNASHNHMTIHNIIKDATDSEFPIILNPYYQRKIIWKEDKKSKFINSILLGIMPNNLIFNNDNKTGEKICLDGKQRITSLKQFKNNVFPVEFEDEYIFYSKVPDDLSHKNNYREMTRKERSDFVHSSMPTVSYNNLSYEDQVNIFNRIQNGVALEPGELIPSLFTSDSVGKTFNKFCLEKAHLFKKFITENQIKREKHRVIITYILYMINNNTLKKPNKNERSEYLTKLNRSTKLKNELNKVSDLIDFCFGEQILGHSSVTKKITISMYLAIIFTINKNINNIKKIKDNDFKCEVIRSSIRKLLRKELETKGTIDNMEKISRRFLKIYKQNINGKLISESESEDKSELGSSEEIEESEESTEVVVKKKRRRKN